VIVEAVLCAAPHEVLALRTALIEGRVNGLSYNDGECGCLVGTLAIARNTGEYGIADLVPDSSRPAERFFLAISTGDTPVTSEFSRLAVEWIDLWHCKLAGAFVGQQWPGMAKSPAL